MDEKSMSKSPSLSPIWDNSEVWLILSSKVPSDTGILLPKIRTSLVTFYLPTFFPFLSHFPNLLLVYPGTIYYINHCIWILPVVSALGGGGGVSKIYIYHLIFSLCGALKGYICWVFFSILFLMTHEKKMNYAKKLYKNFPIMVICVCVACYFLNCELISCMVYLWESCKIWVMVSSFKRFVLAFTSIARVFKTNTQIMIIFKLEFAKQCSMVLYLNP